MAHDFRTTMNENVRAQRASNTAAVSLVFEADSLKGRLSTTRTMIEGRIAQRDALRATLNDVLDKVR